jgi:hydroxypyruvate isomerase
MNEKDNNSKINLKVGEIEFTIEGPSDFVSKQYREMEKKLGIQEKLTEEKTADTRQKTKKGTPGRPKKKTSTKSTTKSNTNTQATQVSQWMKQVPKKLKNTDKALVAAYLNQLASGENTFKVRDVSNTLKEYGIKVSNPSNLMRNAEKARKLIEQISKTGRQAQYRFTKEGEEYVRKIFPGLSSK